MSHEYCVELVPIFNHLPKESMALISKVAQHRTYKKMIIYFEQMNLARHFILFIQVKCVYST